jgi:hypothetical protein
VSTPIADAAIAEARAAIGRPLATSLATENPNDRPFLLEGLFAGVAIYLLEQYGEGFLEGLGFKNAARGHGERARAFFKRLRHRNDLDDDLAAEKQAADAMLREIRAHEPTEDARVAGRRAVEDTLLNSGAVRRQATDVAVQVERAALGG